LLRPRICASRVKHDTASLDRPGGSFLAAGMRKRIKARLGSRHMLLTTHRRAHSMTYGRTEERSMHTPNPGSRPEPDDEDDDIRQPPVPPDQEHEVIPKVDPPKPGGGDPPMIAALRRP
jgi:hypothetical protein